MYTIQHAGALHCRSGTCWLCCQILIRHKSVSRWNSCEHKVGSITPKWQWGWQVFEIKYIVSLIKDIFTWIEPSELMWNHNLFILLNTYDIQQNSSPAASTCRWEKYFFWVTQTLFITHFDDKTTPYGCYFHSKSLARAEYQLREGPNHSQFLCWF